MPWIDITPVAKPRMTRSDKWKKRDVVVRYISFAEELRLKYAEDLPNEIHLIFCLPIPESYSKKKRDSLHMTPHTKKPDLDNLVKSVLDAKCKNDSHINTIFAQKVYTKDKPAIYISKIV